MKHDNLPISTLCGFLACVCTSAAYAEHYTFAQIDSPAFSMISTDLPNKRLEGEGYAYSVGRIRNEDVVLGFTTARSIAVSDYGRNRIMASDAYQNIVYDPGNGSEQGTGAQVWANALARWGDTWQVGGGGDQTATVTVKGHVEYGLSILGVQFPYDFSANYGPSLNASVFIEGGGARVIEGREFFERFGGIGNNTKTARIDWSMTFEVTAGQRFDVASEFFANPHTVNYANIACSGGDCVGGFSFYATNTASFDEVFITNGLTLTADSGALKSSATGVYGYVTSVPEPSTYLLFAAGTVFLLRASRPSFRPSDSADAGVTSKAS